VSEANKWHEKYTGLEKVQYFSYTSHQNTYLETHCGTQDKYTETLITYKSLHKRLTSVLHINDVEKDKRYTCKPFHYTTTALTYFFLITLLNSSLLSNNVMWKSLAGMCN
jgi:capsule polysaccharide export protein KpsC/LpsZ